MPQRSRQQAGTTVPHPRFFPFPDRRPTCLVSWPRSYRHTDLSKSLILPCLALPCRPASLRSVGRQSCCRATPRNFHLSSQAYTPPHPSSPHLLDGSPSRLMGYYASTTAQHTLGKVSVMMMAPVFFPTNSHSPSTLTLPGPCLRLVDPVRATRQTPNTTSP